MNILLKDKTITINYKDKKIRCSIEKFREVIKKEVASRKYLIENKYDIKVVASSLNKLHFFWGYIHNIEETEN